MVIAADTSVATNGDIREVGGAANYTGLELIRFLGELADDQEASGDDLLDITSFTPYDRSTDDIFELLDHSASGGPTFNIDQTYSERLYNASILQKNGDEQYSGLKILGVVEAATEIQVIQDEAIYTSFWGTGINAVPADSILNQVLILSRTDGHDIDGKRIVVKAQELSDSYAQFNVTLGSAAQVAAISTVNDLNNQTAQGTIATWDQFTNTEGYQLLDIPQDGSSDPFYAQWTNSAGSTPASPTPNDLYEYGKWAGRRGTSETFHGGLDAFVFQGVTHEVDYDGELGSGPGSENDNVVWGTKFDYDAELASGLSVGEYYTFQTSGAVGKLLALDDDGTTGSVIFAIDPGGTVVDTESFIRSDGTATDGADVNDAAIENGAAVGGRGRLLALLDSGAAGTYWIMLLSGIAPVNDLELYATTTAGVYDDAAPEGGITQGTPVGRTINPHFLGNSTGSNLIGTYGIGMVPSEAVVGDDYTDLGNNLVEPPNNVTMTIGALVSGEDRLLVTAEDGSGGLDYDQLALDTDLTTGTETTVNVTPAIPSDTPSSGTLRVVDDLGIHRYLTYSVFSGNDFTIPSTDFTAPNDATGAQNVYITYLDLLATSATESFTYVYNGDRVHFVRARDGGTAGDNEPIKTFEGTVTMGTNGGSLNIIRTSDA